MTLVPFSEKMNSLINEFSSRYNIPLADAKLIVPAMTWIGSKEGEAEVYMAIDKGRNQAIVAEWLGGDGFNEGSSAGDEFPCKWNIREVALQNSTTP